MNNTEALQVLAEIKKTHGRNYKGLIRQAWMDGNYAGVGLGDWSNKLQNMRNVMGPSWLVNARPGAEPRTRVRDIITSSATPATDILAAMGADKLSQADKNEALAYFTSRGGLQACATREQQAGVAMDC